jgi:hypothetical protein
VQRFTKRRGRIIDYIGFHGAMPVLSASSGEPGILRPDDDGSGWVRVGWPEFFAAVEKRGYVFVYDDAAEPDKLEYRFEPREAAYRELGLGRGYWAKQLWQVLRGLPVVQH